MADKFAASAGEFRGYSTDPRRSLPVPSRRVGPGASRTELPHTRRRDVIAPTNVLQPPWKELSLQREGATFGIWVFLASEMLFFGSLLLLYTAYRVANSDVFMVAGRETDIWYGTVNTAVLMTSSLTMAVAAKAAEADMRRLTIWCLAGTVALGLLFLVFKGFEY